MNSADQAQLLGSANFPILGCILIGMVVVWFVLVTTLFRRLKNKHNEKYRAMGEPSLFLNNSLRTNWTFMKFLFKREHRALNDPFLSWLSDGMMIFFIVYLGIFFTAPFMFGPR